MTKTKTILLVFSLFSLAALSGSFWSFFQKDITPEGIRITAPTDRNVSQKGTAPRTAFVKGESSDTPANLTTTPLLALEWEQVVNKDGATKYKNGDLVITPDKELRIAANAVTSAAIRRHAIEAADIDTNSITSRTIRDSTIQGQDIDHDTTIEVATITAEYGSFQTISAGIWNASMITTAYGGTGLDGSAAGNGTLLIGNGTGYTLATITEGSGITVTNGAGSITLASTLGTIIDLTSEVTGILPLGSGGTNASTIGSAGSIAYSTGTAYAFSAVGTAGQVLVSGGSSTPTWNTLGAASISADSLDFTEFKDALTLDASTDISITGTNVFSLTNTGTGNSFLVNDQASDTTPFVIDASGNVGVGTTTPTTGSKLSLSTSSTSATADTLYGSDTTVSDTGIVTTGTDYSFGLDINMTRTGATGGTINTFGISADVVGDAGGASTATGLYTTVNGADTNRGLYVSPYNSTSTAKTLEGAYFDVFSDGNISSGAATVSGVIVNVSATGATGGTLNNYGNYTTLSGSFASGTGTVNNYGDYIALTGTTVGTSTNTGLYVAVAGADTNYAALFTGGSVGIGDTTPAALFTVGSGDLFQVNSSGAIAAAAGITSSGTITFSGLTAGGVVQAASGTGLLSVSTLGASGITADSLDFTELQDQLDLDASTDISITGTNVFSLTNTGTGNSFVVNDAASDTTPFVIAASGSVGIGTATPAQQLEITGNFRLPLSTATTGIIYAGTTRLIHTYSPGAETNFFAGKNAGNLTLTGSIFGANTGVGTQALSGLTTGRYNTGVGYQTLMGVTSGNLNVALGYGTGISITTGSENTLIGNNAGGTITSGTKNTLIGTNADVTVATLTNATAIGYAAFVGASNSLVLGGTGANAVNVGIGDTTPDGKLDVESTGAVTVADYGLNLSNLTTNITTDAIDKYGIAVTSTGSFTGSAGTATNNYGIYLTTTSGGDNNYQIYDQSGAYLSTAGTWTNAPSYRRYKEEFTGTESYLDRLMTLDVYEWQYKNQKIDGINRYEDDPYRHASPFLDDFYSTFNLGTDRGYNIQDLAGVTLASVKELNQRFIDTNNQNETVLADLNLQTSENITTLSGLQASVDAQLTVVGTTFVNHDSRITNQETQTTDLESQVAASQIQLASQGTRLTALETLTDQITLDINAQASQTTLLETQMQTLTEQLATLTDFYATFDLGNLVAKDTLGNVDLLDGKLRAKILETGALVIENAEIDAPTIGRGKIKIGETKVVIETKGVHSTSHIIVTPRDLTAEPLAATEVIDAESFIVEIPSPTTKDISFDWWVVEEK